MDSLVQLGLRVMASLALLIIATACARPEAGRLAQQPRGPG